METRPRQVQHLALSTDKYRRYINILYYYLYYYYFYYSPWRNRSQTKGSSPWATAICPRVKSRVSVCFKSTCWCNSKSIAEPTFVIFPCFCLKFFRPCPHESAHFWNRLNTIFIRIGVGGALTYSPLESGFKTMCFGWPDSLVSSGRNWGLFV